MASINNKSTPWILAISSMLLLLIFVGYWNYSTYKKEKNQLADDVEIQLQLAYTETKDSELILFIKTQLIDTMSGEFFPDSLSIFFDEHPMFTSLRKIQTNKSDPNKEIDTTIIIDFNLNNSISDPHNRKISKNEVKVIATKSDRPTLLDFVNDTSNVSIDIKQVNVRGTSDDSSDFDLRTDSLFQTSWHSSRDSLPFRYEAILNSDSGHFGLENLRFNDTIGGHNHTSVDKTYALFKDKLIANNLPTDFKIVKNPKTSPDGLRVNYATNDYGYSEWIVDVQQYRLFLLNKMIPTILFSLVLLGMIGLAFWTLLSNWIKQNRLVVVKNEFINNMTHELKTPISTIGVALEAISNFNLDTEKEKAEEYLEISRNEVNRLSLLVDKVLNIAAFDSNEVTLNSEPVDIDKVIQNTLASLKLHLENNNVEINYINNAVKSKIIGDKLHMRNVIHNIIDNAIKYTSKDPIIDIHLTEKDQSINLSIKDNGQGIPKEYQNKIFDKFFRVPNNDIHDVKGHGLGLNYVKNVIENFNGKISLESFENQGTTFNISFPKPEDHV